MIPDTAYPTTLPLTRKAALDLLDRLDVFDAVAGAFVTFVQIPVEERIGEWRFSGASGTLAGSIRRIEAFAEEMGLHDPGRPGGILRLLLEDNDDTNGDREFTYPEESPETVTGPHRVVLCVQYGAPYEGLGACVVEVESLAASSFEGRAPETERPKQWNEDCSSDEDDEDDEDEA